MKILNLPMFLTLGVVLSLLNPGVAQAATDPHRSREVTEACPAEPQWVHRAAASADNLSAPWGAPSLAATTERGRPTSNPLFGHDRTPIIEPAPVRAAQEPLGGPVALVWLGVSNGP
jgi:hypothetical protein